jgi:hypothetical protein
VNLINALVFRNSATLSNEVGQICPNAVGIVTELGQVAQQGLDPMKSRHSSGT